MQLVRQPLRRGQTIAELIRFEVTVQDLFNLIQQLTAYSFARNKLSVVITVAVSQHQFNVGNPHFLAKIIDRQRQFFFQLQENVFYRFLLIIGKNKRFIDSITEKSVRFDLAALCRITKEIRMDRQLPASFCKNKILIDKAHLFWRKAGHYALVKVEYTLSILYFARAFGLQSHLVKVRDKPCPLLDFYFG